MDLQIFRKLDEIFHKLTSIEKRMSRLEDKMDESLLITRNHLVRIKNKQELSDSSVLLGSPYNDLSPQLSWSIFNNQEADFVIVDVSDLNYPNRIEGAKRIPLEELTARLSELPAGSFPIMVISERGIRSIKACEILVKKGYFNTNNISGGHECWPGHPQNKVPLPPSIKVA